MPHYEYKCCSCDYVTEIFHGMSDETKHFCPQCKKELIKQIGTGYLLSSGLKPSSEDRKEFEHTKKVKDKDRAIKKRRKLFGSDDVGSPVDKPDPRHIVKKGKYLAGAETEVDKKALIKALAKDDYAVNLAKKSIQK